MTRTIAAAALAAALAAGGALALEGVYTIEGQPEVFTFTADGHITGTTVDGVVINDAYAVEGDQVTITAPDDHPLCPGAVGVYTFVETDADVTFTLVSDECEERGTGMVAGPWTKVTEE